MRRTYNTDVSNEEWEIIAPMLPKPPTLGRTPKTDFREVLNGIFYITKNGCTWANLPHDLPPYSTVYFYFQRWAKTGVERTFAWIGKYRRLSKEYEFYEYTSESFIYLALIRKMLRNLTAVNS